MGKNTGKSYRKGAQTDRSQTFNGKTDNTLKEILKLENF